MINFLILIAEMVSFQYLIDIKLITFRVNHFVQKYYEQFAFDHFSKHSPKKALNNMG